MENGRPRRDKGIRGELEARDLWRRWFPDCKRTIGQARRGSEAPDIGCPEMNKQYYVEVKRYGKITDGLLYRLFQKMMADWLVYTKPIDDGVCPFPVLMFRQDDQPWYVALVPEYSGEFYVVQQYAEYWVGELAIIPWSAFEAALDRLHERSEV